MSELRTPLTNPGRDTMHMHNAYSEYDIHSDRQRSVRAIGAMKIRRNMSYLRSMTNYHTIDMTVIVEKEMKANAVICLSFV